MATKDSKEQDIQKATLNGGVIYVGGVRTYIDNPRNYDVVECASGFWIMNALGWNHISNALQERRLKMPVMCCTERVHIV